MTILQNIHIEIIDGVARVVGTRFKVEDVAAIYVLGESPIDWMVDNYPLTRAQIHAALAYYYDHQDEIEQAWREADELIRQHATPLDKVIARLKARVQPPSGE
jgi:uncharacterized protein (DUF433 family)